MTTGEIADYFENLIRQGKIMPGYKLPSADQIMVEFKVGRKTAQGTLTELQRRGVVVVRHRVGAFAVAA